MPYPGLLNPEPLPLQQATTDPYLCRRHSTQFCLSLCGVSGSWCTQGLFESSEGLWWVWCLILTLFHKNYHSHMINKIIKGLIALHLCYIDRLYEWSIYPWLALPFSPYFIMVYLMSQAKKEGSRWWCSKIKITTLLMADLFSKDNHLQ